MEASTNHLAARERAMLLCVISKLSMCRNEFPMTQKRARLPGSDETSGRRLADRISDAGLRLRVMRPSFVSLLMRPTAPPIWLGIAVAGSLIVVETFAVIYLRQLTGKPFGTLYMVSVLVVSTVWGFGLSSITSVVSAWPTPTSVPGQILISDRGTELLAVYWRLPIRGAVGQYDCGGSAYG